MKPRRYNVLLLCVGNTARTILAEALFRRHGYARFNAYSAGSEATGEVHPDTLDLLRAERYEAGTFCSKGVEQFLAADAPRFDIVITVCDAVAGEHCPVFPNAPVRAHWGLPDPTKVTEPEARRAAFRATYLALERRIQAMLALPETELLSSAALQRIHDED